MTTSEPDRRGPARRTLEEQIAAEPPLAPPELPASAPMEVRIDRRRPRPVAVAGVVEIGLVRPLDPAVKLPEHARDDIVAAEGT